ncbi:MAG: flagellar basal body protein, partial [Fimbriimonadales bacterium]
MPSFQGIEIGARAMRAFQIGLEVTGHNVANVNTPGFSRRRVHFANTPEYA